MNNEPAFPVKWTDREGWETTEMGLTKREYFAAMAMQGLMAVNDKGTGDMTWQESCGKAAEISVMMADELLKQLSDEKE